MTGANELDGSACPFKPDAFLAKLRTPFRNQFLQRRNILLRQRRPDFLCLLDLLCAVGHAISAWPDTCNSVSAAKDKQFLINVIKHLLRNLRPVVEGQREKNDNLFPHGSIVLYVVLESTGGKCK